MKDVKVRRGADVGSDHELVVPNIQLKMCRQSVEKSGRKRYDVDKLRVYETAQEFRIALGNRFQVLEQTERVDCWSVVKEAICGASEEVLGFRTHAQPGWMTGRSLEKVSDRKAIKDKMNATKSERLKTILKNKYIAKDKEVKNIVRADKRTYMDDLAKQAEHAANRGEQRTLFTLTKKITNESSKKRTPVKNKDGEVIKSEADQIERWREHFSEVLNSEAPDDPVDVPNN